MQITTKSDGYTKSEVGDSSRNRPIVLQ